MTAELTAQGPEVADPAGAGTTALGILATLLANGEPAVLDLGHTINQAAVLTCVDRVLTEQMNAGELDPRATGRSVELLESQRATGLPDVRVPVAEARVTDRHIESQLARRARAASIHRHRVTEEIGRDVHDQDRVRLLERRLTINLNADRGVELGRAPVAYPRVIFQ